MELDRTYFIWHSRSMISIENFSREQLILSIRQETKKQFRLILSKSNIRMEGHVKRKTIARIWICQKEYRSQSKSSKYSQQGYLQCRRKNIFIRKNRGKRRNFYLQKLFFVISAYVFTFKWLKDEDTILNKQQHYYIHCNSVGKGGDYLFF